MKPSAPISTSQQLGIYLRALRKSRGLTQSDVARMLGVTKMRVATIEKDVGRVSTASVIELIHLLGGTLHLDMPTDPTLTGAQSLKEATDPDPSTPARRPKGEW